MEMVVYYKAERRRCKTCRKKRHHSTDGKCLICLRRSLVPDWRPGMDDPIVAKKIFFGACESILSMLIKMGDRPRFEWKRKSFS